LVSEIYAQKLDYVNQGVLEDFIRKMLKPSYFSMGIKGMSKNIFCSSKIKLGSGDKGNNPMPNAQIRKQ